MDSRQFALIKCIGDQHYKDMVSMGWIAPRKSDAHYLMLTIGEICEAIQAHRKGHVLYTTPVPDTFVSDYVDDPHTPKQLFLHTFEYYCKDTTMDEFADVLLRLLSLLWMRGWYFNPPSTVLRAEDSFTEQAMSLVTTLQGKDAESAVNEGVSYILLWADTLGIDIIKACSRKMRYNKLRADWKNNEKSY